MLAVFAIILGGGEPDEAQGSRSRAASGTGAISIGHHRGLLVTVLVGLDWHELSADSPGLQGDVAGTRQ